MDDLERRVRERAYGIWEREGCPDGRQEEHWRQALDEIQAETGQQLPDLGVPDDVPVPPRAAADGRAGEEGTAAAPGRARRSRPVEDGNREAAADAVEGTEATVERSGRGRRRPTE